MPRTSRYPVFHKYVTRVYLVVICVLAVCLPISYFTIKQPSVKTMIGIIFCVIIAYVVYWLIVRLNCYGIPLQERRNTPTTSNNNHNTNTIYIQPPISNNSTTSHSSNGGSSNTTNHHPTFASYRLGGLTEIFRRFGGNSGASTPIDDEISSEMEETSRPPPPTYSTALEGAGLPPPYMNDSIEINMTDSDSQQMSGRNVPPRRPVPSVPSSSSLRRPVPPIPQQQQYTQSTQYTSQDPSSPRPVPSIPQLPRHSVPPTSSDNTSQSPRRPVPTSSSSSSTLPPRLYKSISH